MKRKIFGIIVASIVCVYAVNGIICYLDYPKMPSMVAHYQKRAIVVGATSGMGRQVAKLLAKEGYVVGLVGRRKKLLKSLQNEIDTEAYLCQLDLTRKKEVRPKLKALVEKMGGLDLMVISVSALRDVDTEELSDDIKRAKLKKFIDVDVLGFWKAACFSVEYFVKQKYGHLVGFSSVDGLRGSPYGAEYSGAKAFVAKYLEGVRNWAHKQGLPIYVTDVIPGPVDVERRKYSDTPGMFWVATAEEAATQIVDAIKKRKEKAYVLRKWSLGAWLLAIAPDWLYRRVW